ncbi:MAG: hypothetical protein GY854_29590 [Deltaproteobacteria bacterium]|nr:hypothetical protein [Deltaproteobacteria bacterium]
MRVKITLILALVLLLAGERALAAVDVCVVVSSDDEDKQGFTKLVLSELGRHPSHRVVKENCRSNLSVDLFRVGTKRFLTARIDKEVPIRYEIAGDNELSKKLKDALTLVLGNDPAHLAEDIGRYSLMQRASHSILKRGTNIWRFELYQTLSRGGGHVLYAPGGAIAVTRGADNWQVLARIYFAGRPGALESFDPILRISTGGDVGITYEFSAASATTFYLSAGAGVQYLRHEGRVEYEGDASQEHINEVGAILFARAGLRFLRLYDFDCDVFVTGYLPLFNTNEPDSLLFGDKGLYTPSIQVGMGVGF